MMIRLHKNAATTPRQRAYIQASDRSIAELARELGVNETTIRRWKGRRDTADRSHTPHRLNISLSPAEEEIGVELRVRLALSLDDAHEVMRRCLRPDISRSCLYRLWRRRGIAGPRPPDAPLAPPVQRFEPQPFGFVHADLKHLPRLDARPAYVFVVIERTTRFVHVEILDDRHAGTVAAAFERFLDAFGYEVHTVLTDNVLCREAAAGFGQQISMRRQPSARHAF